jgi:hypothetical protein
MPHERVVVLHSRQPMGEGLRRAALACSVQPPIILTDAQGPLFRDSADLASLRVERHSQTEWWNLISSLLPAVPLVVTNDEFCLETCRIFRDRLDQADVFPTRIVHYRDKALMREQLRSARVPVPASVAFRPGHASGEALRKAFEQLGSERAVLKPCDEANLRGIRIIESATRAECIAAELKPDAGYLLEAFYPGTQYHVNCLVYDGQVRPLLAGEYTAPLLDLASAKPAGSITLDAEHPEHARLTSLASEAIRVLGAQGRFVAHAEFLSSQAGLVVGEVACRAPGGDVPWQALQHCGLDIEELNIMLQLGGEPAAARPRCAAGWLWFPGSRTLTRVPDAGTVVQRFHGLAWLGQATSTEELRRQVSATLQCAV